MLSDTYTKIVDCRKKFFFPVFMQEVPAFQTTLACSWSAGSLYYELEYVEGPLLRERCFELLGRQEDLIEFLNTWLQWYHSNVVFEFDGEYLMVNADSNAANIVVTGQGFVHIDNQTDFLRTTSAPERPYFPLFKLLSELWGDDLEPVERLDIPLEAKDWLLDAKNRQDTNETPRDISELSDQLVSTERDELYEKVLAGEKRPSGLLSELLLNDAAPFRWRLPEDLYQVIRKDFVKAKLFTAKFGPFNAVEGDGGRDG